MVVVVVMQPTCLNPKIFDVSVITLQAGATAERVYLAVVSSKHISRDTHHSMLTVWCNVNGVPFPRRSL